MLFHFKLDLKSSSAGDYRHKVYDAICNYEKRSSCTWTESKFLLYYQHIAHMYRDVVNLHDLRRIVFFSMPVYQRL